jgi:acetyl esterase/lipase
MKFLKSLHNLIVAAIVLCIAPNLHAKPQTNGSPESAPATRTVLDVVYKTVGAKPLKLDIYLPDQSAVSSPLIVWIHGGGWREGSKSGVPILPFVSSGFAVASVEYRLSGEAPFPAQIEDVKSAIRWLRAHAKDYKLDGEHTGVIGHSAGGHLASLAGATGDGDLFATGENLQFSSAVQAVCVMSGPSDLVAMFDGADLHRSSALVGLLGGPITEKRKLAEKASPLNHVKPGMPPYIFIHGVDDVVVPLQQAKTMIEKLEQIGATPKSILLPHTGHDVFVKRQQYVDDVRMFFIKNLAKK